MVSKSHATGTHVQDSSNDLSEVNESDTLTGQGEGNFSVETILGYDSLNSRDCCPNDVLDVLERMGDILYVDLAGPLAINKRVYREIMNEVFILRQVVYSRRSPVAGVNCSRTEWRTSGTV